MNAWDGKIAAGECSWGSCDNAATVEHTHLRNGEVLWSARPFCDSCATTDRSFVQRANGHFPDPPISIVARPLDPERQIFGEAIGLAFERLAVPQ